MMEKEGHEQLVFCQSRQAKLKAIISIHNTVLGPGLGGCRMWKYQSEAAAIVDAIRLAKGMTYKSGATGVDFGGSKVVIYGDPEKDKSEALFRTLGRFIEGLAGRCSTGTDVGTTADDFVIVGRETQYVAALPEEYGGSGDTSVITAYGTWHGMKACAQKRYNNNSLKGLKVAVQGAGKVGAKLISHLIDDEGAEVVVTDVNQKNLQQLKKRYPELEIVAPEEIYQVPCHIFSPNALGAIINDETIDLLQCDIIAGASNNVLADQEKHGRMLWEKQILYAPDYVINAGGLIQVADETAEETYCKERAFKKASNIYNMLLQIFALAEEHQIPTHLAADKLVENRIKAVENVKSIFCWE